MMTCSLFQLFLQIFENKMVQILRLCRQTDEKLNSPSAFHCNRSKNAANMVCYELTNEIVNAAATALLH